MAQPGIFAVAGSIALFTLSACANSPDPAPASGSSGATKASVTQFAPETSPTTAKPQPVDREVFTYTGFISPTGNVSCMIDVDLARCDIIDRDWSPPPRPADCEFDYGQGIEIVPGGLAAFVCAGDTAFGAENVLAYGDSITAGPLRCESADAGITCRDTETAHGFSLAQRSYQVF